MRVDTRLSLGNLPVKKGRIADFAKYILFLSSTAAWVTTRLRGQKVFFFLFKQKEAIHNKYPKWSKIEHVASSACSWRYIGFHEM